MHCYKSGIVILYLEGDLNRGASHVIFRNWQHMLLLIPGSFGLLSKQPFLSSSEKMYFLPFCPLPDWGLQSIWKDDVQASSPTELVPDVACLVMQLEKIGRTERIEILTVSPIDDLKTCHLAQVKMTRGTVTHWEWLLRH